MRLPLRTLIPLLGLVMLHCDADVAITGKTGATSGGVATSTPVDASLIERPQLGQVSGAGGESTAATATVDVTGDGSIIDLPAPRPVQVGAAGALGEVRQWSAGRVTAIACDKNAGIYVAGGEAFLTRFSRAEGRLADEPDWIVGDEEGRSATAVALGTEGDVTVAGVQNTELPDGTYGDVDAFVAQYSRSGERQWLTELISDGEDRPTDVAVADDGTIYVSGRTTGVLGDRKGGGENAFIAAYSSSGTQLWINQYGASVQSVTAGIAVLGDELVVAGGSTGDLFGVGTDASGSGTFVAKLRLRDGQKPTPLWVTFVDSVDGYADDLAIDSQGNILVVGRHDGGEPVPNPNEDEDLSVPLSSGDDGYLVELSPSGALLRTWFISTYEGDVARGVAVDSNDHAYVVGDTFGTFTTVNAGLTDAFVAKFDLQVPAGREPLWTRQFGSFDEEYGEDVCVAPDGTVFIGGTTWGSLLEETAPISPKAFVVEIR